mmetsp:Transcript_17666/g.15477  ORF Transcript_17666/g.15477 Transcript_17666/m.15477 type:complete len:153 (-) Transcript_17666:1309-1767(-)
MKNPNTIILAITAANTDLANSDSLKLAGEIDPEKKRTIGIVTKLDLMDESTDYLDALQGKLYELKLGYIGVICRKQKDLEAGKTIQDAIEDEKQFFMNHPKYKSYANKLGVAYLIKVLNQQFLFHVKKCLPQIRENIVQMIQTKEYELSQYG